ncbi:MAG: nucleoside triphosphate pyrophosphohydrolase family protein [Candidatus Aenigmarchaeota archaeon]|nr:nucleoside triphosphate pyrophosphohydrolase family protein [Candidatus Aenigmarchaeota archaeon]
MNFEDYQKKSRETVFYPNPDNNFVYPIIGLTGEAGEVANVIKGFLKEGQGAINEKNKERVAKELGDLLWYIAQLATEFGLSLDKIAESNIEKIMLRKKNGEFSKFGDKK